MAGCDSAPSVDLFSRLGPPQRNVALTRASMMSGAVMLRPPQGYCIDKRSLEDHFAVMSRCDTLGAKAVSGDVPLGIIVASFTPLAADQALPDPAVTAAALNLRDISETEVSERSVTFRATGDASVAGTAADHWRATARVGNHLMGLALYGPKAGPAIRADGRALLNDVLTGTSPLP